MCGVAASCVVQSCTVPLPTLRNCVALVGVIQHYAVLSELLDEVLGLALTG